MSRTSSCGTAVTTATSATNKGETIQNIVDEVIENEQGTYIRLL